MREILITFIFTFFAATFILIGIIFLALGVIKAMPIAISLLSTGLAFGLAYGVTVDYAKWLKGHYKRA